MKDLLTTDFRNAPYWWDATPLTESAGGALASSYDAIIVGSGYTGLRAALALARAGRSVAVFDKELPGSGYSVRHDGPIAAAYLMLAARAFGYGTAYLTDGISDEVTRAALGIPPRYHRVCITPIGVPERWPEPPPKRALEAMIAYETLEGFRPAERLPYKPS